jgi:UMP-CMP kinase
LAKEFDFVHLSAGELLRREREAGSSNGKLIDEYLKEGRIVPVNAWLQPLAPWAPHPCFMGCVQVSVSLSLLKKAMDDAKQAKCFLIDGFPRNQDNVGPPPLPPARPLLPRRTLKDKGARQLDGWTREMADYTNVLAVLYYDCSIEVQRARLLHTFSE